MSVARKMELHEIKTIPRHYYFLMKAGFGNQFLRKAKEWNGLWVGNPDKKQDEPLMNEALESSNLNRVRILTFGPHYLHVWKPTGPRSREAFLKIADDPVWRNATTYSKFPKGFQSKLKGPDFFSSAEFQEVFATWTLIPAELDFEIPRSRLIAPIDSLSVYQFLNRGTFRPVYRIGQHRKIPHLDRLSTDPLPPLRRKGETELGKFVRIYLEGYARPMARSLDLPLRPLACLQNKDLEDVIISILNPAQLETVASLFALDIGLAPDVGIGKAIDVIDVRATCRHKRERDQIVENVMKHLRLAGVKPSPQLIENAKANYSLSIQCKDYESGGSYPGILVLKPYSKEQPEDDVLPLAKLFKRVRETDRYPLLRAWLDLLTHDLRG